MLRVGLRCTFACQESLTLKNAPQLHMRAIGKRSEADELLEDYGVALGATCGKFGWHGWGLRP